MRLLLISNSTNFGENYLAWASTQIELFCLQNHIIKDSRIIFESPDGQNCNAFHNENVCVSFGQK